MEQSVLKIILNTIFRFDDKMMKEAVSYIINNFYFTIGDQVFREIIGIPMGSDPAQCLANLFL